jgi:putative membrane protein
MKHAFLLGASALMLMAGGAFAAPVDQPGHKSPAPGSNNEAVSATQDATAALVGTVSAEMTSTTKGFATAAAVSDMYEVAAGKLAMQRAQSPAVKDFARQMVEAHTKTTEKLKGIIAGDKIDVAPPAHVDSRRQGMLDNLRGASAADFDHRYVVQQVAAHREADILFRGYAKDGDNAAIRSFAAETDPTIKMHLQMAQALDKGGSRSASR